MSNTSKWETLGGSVLMDRFSVPGGWLYRVHDEITFVPEPCPLPADKAVPAHDQVVVGAKMLSDLIEATAHLLQGVKRHDWNGGLLHECDVVHVALGKVSKYMPEGKIRDRSNELSEASIG